MKNQQAPTVVVLGILTSVIGGILLGVGSWLVSQSWSVFGVAILAWLIVIIVVFALFRRLYLSAKSQQIAFRKPMTSEEAGKRIDAARLEIWSFQISGSEFTAHSPDTYRTWLEKDRNRRLKIAFADPDDNELLKNIVKLSGVANLSSEDHAYEHLRELIRTTLGRYRDLCCQFAEQVDVRVYDFSPPFSVHATDPDDENASACSLFVELYLPDLPAHERPSMLLGKSDELFSLYREKSRAWFNAAVPIDEAVSSNG
jgi:hypothetical protein